MLRKVLSSNGDVKRKPNSSSSSTGSTGTTPPNAPALNRRQEDSEIVLALGTLAHFHRRGFLIDFDDLVHEIVANFLEGENPEIRKEVFTNNF